MCCIVHAAHGLSHSVHARTHARQCAHLPMTAVAPASFAALVVVVAVGLAEGVGRPPPARAVASRSHESDASMAGRAPHASMAGRAGGDRWLGAASGCAADMQ